MKKEIVCIVCPRSCHIQVKNEGSNVIHINGAGCKKGVEFVKNEIANPVRIFTGSVRVEDGNFLQLSVKTSKAISKKYLHDLGEFTHKLKVQAPIKIGDKILENVLGEGIDLIATRNVDKIPC